jgi:hypothetical protein
MPVAARLAFRMDGPEFIGGIPVLKAAEALKEFHSIVDKSYLVVVRKGKLTHYDREQFKLSATKIEAGSLQAAIEVIVPAVTVGLEVLRPYGGVAGIWEIAKNAFEFLRAFATLTHRGVRPLVRITGNQGASQVVIVGDNTQIHVGLLVFHAAIQSESHFESLADMVDGAHVENISAVDEAGGGIVLSPEHSELFKPHAVVDDSPLTFVARVFRLDVRSRTGRLRILDAGLEGEYPFSIAGGQPLAPFAAALASPSATVTALRKIIVHPSGTETVSSYVVLEIHPLPG